MDFKGHLILSGSTYSGKSFLLKRIIEDVRRQMDSDPSREGELIFVLDKFSNGSDWPCDFHTREAGEFIEACQMNERVWMVIDEGGSSLDKHDDGFAWLGTESRHFGHKLCLATQRAQSIAPSIREQCSQLYLFNIAPKAAKIWGEEFNEPDLRQAANLPQYEFLFKERFQKLRRGKFVE